MQSSGEISTEGESDLDHEFRKMAELLVGRVGLKEALCRLRTEMNHAALARTQGSRRGAASMLQVDRRYVQRLVHENGEPEYLQEVG